MTSLKPVAKDAYSGLFQAYVDHADIFYPLIGNVLDGKQSGSVFAADQDSYFIIHKFGFAQFFTTNDNTDIYSKFLELLMDADALKELNLNTKLRIYCPSESGSAIIKKETSPLIQISERMQMRLEQADSFTLNDRVESISAENINKILTESPVDLDSRFWDSAEAFLQYGLGCYTKKHGYPAGLCYSAALSQNVAEIDIFVMDGHRKDGLGKILGQHFIAQCQSHEITPNWDCFTNNIASCTLAAKLGFKAQRVYDFYTIELSHI